MRQNLKESSTTEPKAQSIDKNSSTLINEVINEFLEKLNNDESIPDHFKDQLRKHFQVNSTLTSLEFKKILFTNEAIK